MCSRFREQARSHMSTASCNTADQRQLLSLPRLCHNREQFSLLKTSVMLRVVNP